MLETLPLTDWTGPYDAAVKAQAVAALERGAVLFFPQLPFVLADNEKPFLDARVADGKARISAWTITAANCRRHR